MLPPKVMDAQVERVLPAEAGPQRKVAKVKRFATNFRRANAIRGRTARSNM